MQMTKKTIALIVLIAVGVAALIGGGIYAYHKSQEPKSIPEQTEEAEDTEDTSAKSRLTGLPIDESKVNLRPIAIMTENTKSALPQYGLNEAGVIYECPVEGGITRLMCIFDDLGTLEKIGNVRSCRPYYAYIASEFDAIYVHYGQSVQGQEVLDRGIVNDLNGLDGSVSEKVFYRTSDKKAPHNAYTSAAGVAAGIAEKGYDTNYASDYTTHYLFSQDENTLSSGSDCYALSLYYSNNHPYFIYDSSAGLYKRYQFSDAQTDAVDGEQAAVKNIILQNVPSSIYSGTQYLDIPLTGSGEGKYITNGKMIDILWSKDSDTAVTHYYDADGNEIEINPGNTWVSLIENASASKNVFYATESDYENR